VLSEVYKGYGEMSDMGGKNKGARIAAVNLRFLTIRLRCLSRMVR
jgi:hypothetical protein